MNKGVVIQAPKGKNEVIIQSNEFRAVCVLMSYQKLGVILKWEFLDMSCDTDSHGVLLRQTHVVFC